MRRLGTGLIFLALCLCVPAYASAAPSLYASATAVPNQSVAARSKAFTQDLAQVLVKVSGDPAAARFADVLDASTLVLGYRYRKASAERGGGLELWARFDEKRVNAALAGVGEPVWGKNRPSVIAWVATPEGMIGDDGGNPLSQTMRETAAKRGLPLVLPLLDLTDQQAVSTFDIQSFYLPALKKASQRYGVQAMLAGVIKQDAAGVSSQWRLELGQTTHPFSIPAPSAQSAVEAAVNTVATLIAQRYARVPSATGMSNTLVLDIAGVESLKAEVAVRRAVSEVQGVEAVKLSRIERDELRFLVSYDGAMEDFARLLGLSDILTRSGNGATLPAPAGSLSRPTLSFRYTP